MAGVGMQGGVYSKIGSAESNSHDLNHRQVSSPLMLIAQRPWQRGRLRMPLRARFGIPRGGSRPSAPPFSAYALNQSRFLGCHGDIDKRQQSIVAKTICLTLSIV